MSEIARAIRKIVVQYSISSKVLHILFFEKTITLSIFPKNPNTQTAGIMKQ
jgi:hypothetical protein